MAEINSPLDLGSALLTCTQLCRPPQAAQMVADMAARWTGASRVAVLFAEGGGWHAATGRTAFVAPARSSSDSMPAGFLSLRAPLDGEIDIELALGEETARLRLQPRSGSGIGASLPPLAQLKLYASLAAVALQNARKFDCELQRAAAKPGAADNNEKREALAALAHELNNPLTAVLGYAQLFGGDAELPPRLQKPLRIIQAEATRAAALVGQVLAAARAECQPVQEDIERRARAAQQPAGREAAVVAAVPIELGAEHIEGAGRSARVLVVDDEEPVVMLISEVLAQDGHQVTAAYNGAEALALLDRVKFDLILSDVRMPAVGGPTFFELLQTTRADLLPRVIFVTGDTVSASSREFFRRTGRPLLSKPFEPERLRALVNDNLDDIFAVASLDEAAAATQNESQDQHEDGGAQHRPNHIKTGSGDVNRRQQSG